MLLFSFRGVMRDEKQVEEGLVEEYPGSCAALASKVNTCQETRIFINNNRRAKRRRTSHQKHLEERRNKRKPRRPHRPVTLESSGPQDEGKALVPVVDAIEDFPSF
jgi:hypothetical protein